MINLTPKASITMKNMLILLLLLVINCCTPNDGMHRTISFNNNSDHNVYVAYSLSYPDTLTDAIGYLEISAKTMRYLDEKIGYENLIAENKEKKIMLFVRNDNFAIVKRYILTLDSLNALNWIIKYP